MVPIYESDVAEERWSKTEWNHYELWEKVEQRIRRHNRLWIAGTVVVFLLLSSVPIVSDQYPRWTALGASRRLAQEIDHMKREAATDHAPMRLRFSAETASGVSYRIEKVGSCADETGSMIRSGTLLPPQAASSFRVMTPSEGEKFSIPGLLESFCYDPIRGSVLSAQGEAVAGFAIAPVKDLAEHRSDRIAVLLVSGNSAELSFE